MKNIGTYYKAPLLLRLKYTFLQTYTYHNALPCDMPDSYCMNEPPRGRGSPSARRGLVPCSRAWWWWRDGGGLWALTPRMTSPDPTCIMSPTPEVAVKNELLILLVLLVVFHSQHWLDYRSTSPATLGLPVLDFYMYSNVEVPIWFMKDLSKGSKQLRILTKVLSVLSPLKTFRLFFYKSDKRI